MSTLALRCPEASVARPAQVRLADPGDEDGLVRCALLEHAENGFSPADPDLIRERVQALTQRDGGMIGAIDGERGIEAAVAVVLSRFWSSQDWHLERLFGFVYPEHRRSGHAKDLLLFAKWVSRSMGLPLLFAEHLAENIPEDVRPLVSQMERAVPVAMRRKYPNLRVIYADPKLRFYERQMEPAGTVFLYTPSPHLPTGDGGDVPPR